jgi:hypothetical protein
LEAVFCEGLPERNTAGDVEKIGLINNRFGREKLRILKRNFPMFKFKFFYKHSILLNLAILGMHCSTCFLI